jgi:hypothetical protein
MPSPHSLPRDPERVPASHGAFPKGRSFATHVLYQNGKSAGRSFPLIWRTNVVVEGKSEQAGARGLERAFLVRDVRT